MKFQFVSPGIIGSAALFCLASVANGQRPNHPAAVNSPNAVTITNTGQFGSPLAGLTATELANFATGQAQFETFDAITPDGLGPIFNAQACVACHSQPNTSTTPVITPPVAGGAVTTAVVNGITPGGASAITEIRAGKLNSNGSFNPLTNEDGTLFHLSSITPSSQETVPQDATIVAHRKATPLFGAGLIEAIPDATIEANVHTTPVDGVTGRAAVLSDAVTKAIGTNFVGRFGWKCQESTVLAFAGDAYLNEMGITNRFFTTDLAPDGNEAALLAAEPAGITPTTLQDLPTNPALPESPTNKDDIARFTDFMQLLAPPPTVPLTAQAEEGQDLFTQIDCVACHKPSMQTGPSTVSAALAFKTVHLYSDLLLHNMGSLNDNIAQADAQPNEMRTAPLWGLRARAPYLHDGRASTIMQAILFHDGEALTIRNRFAALSASQQEAIIAFLESI
jgi:CxxC motif-containing protein (DUF1111 family)